MWHFKREAILFAVQPRHHVFAHLGIVLLNDCIERLRHIVRFLGRKRQHLRCHLGVVLQITLHKQCGALLRHRIVRTPQDESHYKIGRIEREPAEVVRIVARRPRHIAYAQRRVPIQPIHLVTGRTGQQTHFQRIGVAARWLGNGGGSPCEEQQEHEHEPNFQRQLHEDLYIEWGKGTQ